MKAPKPHRVLMLMLLTAVCLLAQAQSANKNYLRYIEQYKDLAIEQMRLHRIPASITLAQGLLESGAGMSRLSRSSNNHFGIKCGSAWRGRSVRHHDDYRNECFRAYRTVRDSYEDHSRFLVNGARYAFLFRLSPTDYRGWARGLKKAGYATEPSYANRLITIIERYQLYKYDYRGSNRHSLPSAEAAPTYNHQVYIANGLAYVEARKGDTFRSLAKEFDISYKKLARYNDLHPDYTLMPGDVVYLTQKHKRALPPHVAYVVRAGDSMHSIAQMFGIRLEELYRMNNKDGEYIPEVGDRLRVR